MRLIILALLLALAFGTAQAYPLQGSDGTATVTIFESIRTPLEENASQEILKVDVGLMGTENATYKLVDANDSVYEPGLYKPLSSGRQLLYFLIPKDDLFKLITVTPLSGKSININWWARPKVGNENLAIRYYGITDWLTYLNVEGIVVQRIVVQVTGQNNGTQDLLFSPENFTLLDQWGWPYNPTAGFDSEIIAPQKTTARVLLAFTDISLFSKPAALVYGYNTANPIVVDFEKDFVPLSNNLVYGANATTSAATSVPASAVPAPALPAPTSTAVSTPAPAANQTNQTAAASANNTTANKLSSLKEKIAATKARLGSVGSTDNSSQKSAVGANISSSLSATRERLAATRANLAKQTQNNTSESTSASNATLNNTLNSTSNNTINNTLNKTPDSSRGSMSESMLSFSP